MEMARRQDENLRNRKNGDFAKAASIDQAHLSDVALMLDFSENGRAESSRCAMR
jgi:hypothetical protein